MNEAKTCPACRKILPEDPLINFCPYCGVHFTPDDARQSEEIDIIIDDATEETLEDHEPEKGKFENEQHHSPGTANGIPWEDEKDQSFIERLTHTWSESIFRPVDFFKNLKPKNTIGPALLYAFIFKFLGQILGNYWAQKQLATMSEQIDQMPAFMQMFFERYTQSFTQMGSLEQLALTPFMVLFSLLLMPVIFHISLSIFGVAQNGFTTTFRVNAYAEGTAIFQAIPIVGGVVYFFMWLVLAVIGWRECHNTTTARVVTALALPFFACCTLIVILFSALGTFITG
ncbi:MAG: YIP1 family protein [Deferribacteres bacterium]|nr:YIP1 family protein [candidate division KSB1 bacterium]MCB9503645.1 YIP1 family protein [Deferribacteres bacterium]